MIFRHRQGALPLARVVEDSAGARNNGLGVDSSETFLAVWSYVAEARLGAAVASFKQQPTSARNATGVNKGGKDPDTRPLGSRRRAGAARSRAEPSGTGLARSTGAVRWARLNKRRTSKSLKGTGAGS